MIDIGSFLTSELIAVYPTYNELYMPTKCDLPCISYNIVNNSHDTMATNLIYSRITVTLKIYSYDYIEFDTINEMDNIMILCGFKRTSGQDVKIDPDIKMYVATYEILMIEDNPMMYV